MRLVWLKAWLACTALLLAAQARAEPEARDRSALDSLEALQHSLLGESGDDGLFSGDVAALGESSRPQAPQVIYRYTRSDGRDVYTNILDQVPEAQRSTAVMDLSKVTLSSELGQELEHKLGLEHGALVRTDYCAGLREQAGQSFLDGLWEEYAPLLVCGGVLVLFLLFTPIALKRVSAPAWARTLTMAIPSLALAGVISFSMMKTNEALVKVRAAAKPCETATFKQLAREDNPIGKQATLVNRLRQQIAQLDALGESDGRKTARTIKRD